MGGDDYALPLILTFATANKKDPRLSRYGLTYHFLLSQISPCSGQLLFQRAEFIQRFTD